MAGKRVSLSALAGASVEAVPGSSKPTLAHLTPAQLFPTPLNPRRDFDPAGLRELGESMRGGQLQPCVGISRAAYIRLFPEHADQVPDCRVVMAAGERRWRAAQEVGLPTLDVHIREDLAETRVRFLSAVLTENVERQNFNYIEEAMGLKAMLEFSGGNQTQAAAALSKSKQWFSQRVGILRLTPEMQELVVTGKLKALRDMRRYAAMPPEEQLRAWQADEEAKRRLEEERRQIGTRPARPAGAESPPPADPASGQSSSPEGYTAVYAESAPQQPAARQEPTGQAGGSGQAQLEPSASLPSTADSAPSGTAALPSTPPASSPPVAVAAAPAPVPDPRTEPGSKGPTRMPWADGVAAMDIIFENLLISERVTAIGRYLELLGDAEAFADQMAQVRDSDYRRRLAELLQKDL